MSAHMIQAVGSALLHFLWQGAALAMLLWIAISFTRNPRVRYGVGVVTLVLMAVCPLITLAFLSSPSTAPTASVSNSFDTNTAAPAISNMTVALSAPSQVTSFDLLTCLVWIWCAGVSLFTARAFGGWLVLQKLRRTAHEAIPPALLDRCRRLQQQIGITAFVCFASSDAVDAPAVVGWFRPVVLIPLAALSGLSTEQIEAIIAHELAHVRRYDALVNLFQIAVETVLFYHPAVWWVNRVIRTERENCCDDVAVAVCGNAGEYARALAAMSSAAPSWAMAANGGALKARVTRLLGVQKITHGIPRAGLATLSLLCASCLLLAAGSFKQAPPPSPVVPDPPAPVAVEPPSPAAPEAPAPPALDKRQEQQLNRESRKLAKEINKLTLDAASQKAVWRAEQLQQSIAAMKNRYTGDYPELIAAEKELASLQALAGAVPQAMPAATLAPPAEDHKGPSYIDSLASVGLTNLSVDDLIALKIQGVTPEYVRQMKATGFETNVHELIGLKVQGVTPEYIRDIRATGLKPNVHELLEMKVQGVTPDYIRTLQSAGFGELKIHEIIGAKIQGITPEFIQKVHAHGFKDLTFRQLISLKMADVF